MWWPAWKAEVTKPQLHEDRERIALNPDFIALQGDLDALEQLRTQRDVSLNLAKRRTERDVIDAAGLPANQDPARLS